MVFPPSHPTFPDQPKGIKVVLKEHGLWHHRMLLICWDSKCNPTLTSCFATWTLKHQPDFLTQKSLVQETIEVARQLCIFLPKFHCKLNFIEYFWAAVEHYLCECCNYTFAGLQENLPKAVELVDISTIQKWEHKMIRWMDAYRDGSDARDRWFSSHWYTSHCVSKAMRWRMD